jgi:hypothetical protein
MEIIFSFLRATFSSFGPNIILCSLFSTSLICVGLTYTISKKNRKTLKD